MSQVIVLGEDLTRFRNASKDLYRFLRQFSWNGRVESRLMLPAAPRCRGLTLEQD